MDHLKRKNCNVRSTCSSYTYLPHTHIYSSQTCENKSDQHQNGFYDYVGERDSKRKIKLPLLHYNQLLCETKFIQFTCVCKWNLHNERKFKPHSVHTKTQNKESSERERDTLKWYKFGHEEC